MDKEMHAKGLSYVLEVFDCGCIRARHRDGAWIFVKNCDGFACIVLPEGSVK